MTRGKKPAEQPEENSGAEGGADGSVNSLHEMMKIMSGQLNNINTKLEKIDGIESEVRGLRVLLHDLKQENTQLKTQARETEQKLKEMNERSNQLENRLNRLEQHHRGWSARLLNIPLNQEEESDNAAVKKKVYQLALLPILRGAVEKKLLLTVPSADELLETAHVLPGPAGQPRPVIMRFYNRNVRDICFRLKKHYAPRITGDGGTGSGHRGAAGRGREGEGENGTGGFEGRGKYAFPLYEDLTRAAFQKMRAIAKDSRVKSCWSVKGQIKFTLVSKPDEVRKVESLLDHLDTILK
jgi:archaellum component FlaC